MGESTERIFRSLIGDDRNVIRRDDDAVFSGSDLVEQDLVSDAFDIAPYREERTVDTHGDVDVGGVGVAQFGDVPENERQSQ